MKFFYICLSFFICFHCINEDKVDEIIFGKRTEDEKVGEWKKVLNLNVDQAKQLKNGVQSFKIKKDVKDIITVIRNSLHRKKEIAFVELMSYALNSLNKFKILTLAEKLSYDFTEEFSIRVKSDKENKVIHLTDNGIGLTKAELVAYLGTTTKIGFVDAFRKISTENVEEMTAMIQSFELGLFTCFLVAETVIITSKNIEDGQYIGIMNANADSFNIGEDPRTNTLKHGTTISLKIKDEAQYLLIEDNLKDLFKKYSKFATFPVYIWESKKGVIVEEESIAENDTLHEKPKTRNYEKFVWSFQLLNNPIPFWTRKATEISENDYLRFYKYITEDSINPLAKTHFIVEGEISFTGLIYIPTFKPSETFNKEKKKTDLIQVYLSNILISDYYNIQDIMPKYLNFITGIVDITTDVNLISPKTLEQLLKVIRKHLISKTLKMIKSLPKEKHHRLWDEYNMNIKLGVIQEENERTELAELLRFSSSKESKNLTSLKDYYNNMKVGQDEIYFIKVLSIEGLLKSNLKNLVALKKHYEVLYLKSHLDVQVFSVLHDYKKKRFFNISNYKITQCTSEYWGVLVAFIFFIIGILAPYILKCCGYLELFEKIRLFFQGEPEEIVETEHVPNNSDSGEKKDESEGASKDENKVASSNEAEDSNSEET